MTANGDSSKKVWMTECGWLTCTNPAEIGAVSFDRQAHYLTNMFTRFAGYPDVSVACWYTSRSYDESTHEGSFGLMLPDFTRKPSFYAYRDWVAAAGSICPPTHMQLLQPAQLGNGVMRIGLSGMNGATCSLQVSSNLFDWTTIATNISGTNGYYDDPATTNLTERFYRLSWP